MIVDMHTHLFGDVLTPKSWVSVMAQYGSRVARRDFQYVLQRMREDWFDETGDLLIDDMKAAGIDKSVVFVLDLGLFAGTDDNVSLRHRYDLAIAAVARHPEDLLFFGGIDPRRPDALDLLSDSFDGGALKGVKLWPPAGIQPNSADCYRLYEWCERNGLPVVIHTGHELGPFFSGTTRPIFCDEIASRFPQLRIVLAHAGMGWWEEAAYTAAAHEFVYLDIAYWQQKYLRNARRFQWELRSLIDIAGRERVMFGSDWPAFRRVRSVSPKDWIDTLQNSETEWSPEYSLSEEEIGGLLGGNAQRLLQLD